MKIEPFYTLNEMRKEHGVMRTIAIKLNESVERFTSGLDINAVRGVLRGDPAPKPNPRVKPHTEGAIFHMWPTFYHKAVTGLWPTLRLGMISTILFLIEIITGLFLMLWYTPSPTAAYSDMLRILSNVPLGELTRDLHRLAAEFMVFFVAMHMWRTYITGSYKKPRQFTYFTGVVLLLFTILLSYTGYLLPWDQLALWAVTIGASMADAAPPPQVGEAVGLLLRGGLDIGANGLLRFYLLHVFALPLGLILFLFVHYYKVVRHGHSLPPSLETKAGEDNARRVPPNLRVPFLPDIFTTEMFWFGLITAVLVIGSAFFYEAPLESHADHTNTPLHTVAPWYFLWIQGMLKLGDKTIWGVIVPSIFLVAHFFLGYIDYNPSRQYRDRKIALSVSLFTVGTIVILSFMGTSAYLVNSPFEVEVGFEFMRPEKIGEHDVRNVPFEELMPGQYDTAAIDPALEGDAPHLYEALQGLRAQIERYSAPNLAKNLAGGHAIVTITDWTNDADGQPNLRRVHMSVEWPGMPIAEDGTPQPFEKYVYVHRDAIHPSE